MNRPHQPRVIFITGTDTGVGKTLLTGLLLHHLRQRGSHALAMKPFCSGGTADIEILHALQAGEISRQEITPFFFAEPIAPLVAARKHHRSIRLETVLQRIRALARRCQFLLIEGSGGLMVPLGEGFSVADLIARLGCEVLVVSRNRLGTINHTILTVQALQAIGIKKLRIVIMESEKKDASAVANPRILAELLAPTPLIRFPFVGRNPVRIQAVKRIAQKCKKTLARILN